MKKRFKLVSLIVMIIVGTFTFSISPFLFIVGATYVDGPITKDTVWTLTDSPFVVSKNITVYPDATLTIEPGVEVRFGGDFSIIVEGSLSAYGTENNTITFTSNKDQPESGDWNTLEFIRPKPSTLAYCIMQYAKDAVTIKNSNVKIENCNISTNSRNGITIVNSTAEVKNNEITNNLECGIYVTGVNQVTIQNNKISSNENGILLTGDVTTGVSITENTVMLNTHSGIQLDADYYSDLVILDNILSANNHGFYISTQASTYIARNSISYNAIGIFYEKGQSHLAYYNDIYGNEKGMDASSDATVNAEYNYWGHESGPYHISLNPAGEGNPVGGDGVNLDFIFFLTAPIGYLNTRPIARLLTDMTLVPPNQVVTFIAATSSDDGRVDKYFFDFGDGENSGWTTVSIFVHKYSSLGSYNASVTVMDDFGVSSTNVANAIIGVQALNPLNAALTLSRYKISSGEQVPITVDVTYGTSAVENAGITLFAVREGNFTLSSGSTNSTGYFTTTFLAPNVTQATHVRITATVSKSGYAEGSDYKYVTVLPPLTIEVTADPVWIGPEATSEVTTHVTYNGEPVADALVIPLSDGGGNFSTTHGTTDLNGDCKFNFTAPKTTTWLNITITARAIKAGYLDAQDQVKITIEPRILVVELTADRTAISSEETSYVTVHVTYNMTPISGVDVTMSSAYGTFSSETGTTDLNGTATFIFTAPETTTQLNFIITATATKTGYTDGEDQVEITVNFAALQVQVDANPFTVVSGATSTVTVHVASNENPIADAIVTVWSDGGGDFSAVEAMTDSKGDSTFVFTAPGTTTQFDVIITATATKAGYTAGESQTRIIVNPGGGIGLPLIIMIVIAIVIVIVVIVVLLIRLRIINISLSSEEEPE